MKISKKNRPQFENGSWKLNEPDFSHVPPPNEKIILFGWPDEYSQENGKWIDNRKRLCITTPPECNQSWFKGTVQFLMGWNYAGWIYC